MYGRGKIGEIQESEGLPGREVFQIVSSEGCFRTKKNLSPKMTVLFIVKDIHECHTTSLNKVTKGPKNGGIRDR